MTLRFKTFAFDDLPRLKRDEVVLANRLAAIAPLSSGARPAVALTRLLEELVGARYEIHLHAAELHTDPDVDLEWGDAFLTSLQLPPTPARGVLAIDMSLMETWLEALLGPQPLDSAPPEAMARPRRLLPPGERDFGVGTYLLLRALEALKGCGLGPLNLPSTAPDRALLRERLRASGPLAEIVWVFCSVNDEEEEEKKGDQQVGLVRALLPAPLLQALLDFAHGDCVRGRAARRLATGPLSRLPLRPAVGLGRLSLRPLERAALGTGDIVLPEVHGWCGDAARGLGGAQGEGRLWLSRRSALPLTLRAAPSGECEAAPLRWQATIESTEAMITDPEEDEMSDDVFDSAEASSAATMHLQDHATLTMEVRLGSIELSVAQLSRLQTGQIVELSGRVGDLVDLVVQGSVIARGELVDVEGRLGVRIRALCGR